MKTLLVKNVILDGKTVDIFIAGNKIKKISSGIVEDADRILDGRGMHVMPPFMNLHTHAAMAPLRGLSEDKPLAEWLADVWKHEARMTPDLYYWANRMACLEMIKSGTCTFLDMYWETDVIEEAVEKSGMRAVIPYVILDGGYNSQKGDQIEGCVRAFENSKSWCDRTKFAVSIHAPYTVSDENMKFTADFARKNDLLLNIHISETKHENDESFEKYGMSPTKRLDSLGILGDNVIAAHSLWLDDEDIAIYAKNGVTAVHNINSNLKLASGCRFRYQEMKDAGINVTLGTDGAASSNNLDMMEAMKFSALVQKGWREDPAAMPLDDLIRMATVNGSDALRIDNGRIEEGRLADMILIDTDSYSFIPDTNFKANLVYSANSSCVDTMICDGKIIMEGRKVKDEEDIKDNCIREFRKFLNEK